MAGGRLLGRWLVLAVAVLLALLPLAGVAAVTRSSAGPDPRGVRQHTPSAPALTSDEADQGAEVFRKRCAGCHGPNGDKIPGVMLLDKDFLAGLGDEAITTVIVEGKGKMKAMGKANGGPMTDDEVEAVLAYLKAQAEASSAPAVATVPTSITLSASRANSIGEALTLTALLEDEDGNPVEGELVHFYHDIEFLGTRDLMEVASAVTDAEGKATISYLPRTIGDVPLVAKFEGAGKYDVSEATVTVRVYAAEPAYTKAPTSIAIARWGPWVVGIAMGVVWTTMAVAAFQALRVWWSD